tara:strand:+ start:1253 stop:2056 length:804 start_codon:yes stop_codon:yes gene_type:complete
MGFEIWRYCATFVLSVFFIMGFSTNGSSSKLSDMARVPAGPFLMGSSPEDVDWAMRTFFAESLEWYLDETPGQAVYLDEFFIDRHEVTIKDYSGFIEATDKEVPKLFNNTKFNQPNQPVVGATWQDAVEYCTWLGKRLPTESEWEKAARGTDGRRYPWGNNPDPLKGNFRGKKDKFYYTASIGSFPEGQSPYGALDMAGNVFEWTRDWYNPHPGNSQKSDMFGKKFKVIKGGSWYSDMDLARSALRGKIPPGQRSNYVGFRCAKDPT